MQISSREDLRFEIISHGRLAHSEFGDKAKKLVKIREDQQIRKGCIQIHGYILILDDELHEE